MSPGQQRLFSCFVCAVVSMLYSASGNALLFEPVIGGGVEYTDNVRKRPEPESDVVVASYLGARLTENDGPLSYAVSANLNKHNYTRGSYNNQRYFNLAGNGNWEIVKDHLDAFAADYFQQRQVRSINAATPTNLQDSNIFTTGLNLRLPLSERHNFSLTPTYSQYYYEVLTVDNRQVSLSGRWDYQMYRRASIGLGLSTRNIDYIESDISGNRPAGTTFTNITFTINGVQRLFTYSLNLGKTAVKREGGRKGSGFAGSLIAFFDLTSRSNLDILMTTDITDTSRAILASVSDPINGNPDDVQIATDVVRNSSFNVAYLRDDASLRTRIWWNYRELKYSDSPLDRTIRTVGAQMNYPLTRLLSSGVNVSYSRTRELDVNRLDDRYLVNGNLRYQLSRKLYTAVDLSYQEKESTFALQNYDEVSLFVRLVYGPGDLQRPSLAGGGF